MYLRVRSVVFLLVAIPCLADVAVPRGYRLVNLSDGTGFNNWTSMNNSGQIVWYNKSDFFNEDTAEIMIYERGEVRALTSNNVADRVPSINDDGTIVWSSATGPMGEFGRGVFEIWKLENGVTTKIKDEWHEKYPQEYIGPDINNSGHVVWSRRVPLGTCTEAEIWYYDGELAWQRTLVGGSNQLPKINNHGDVVWTRYDFCHPGDYTSETLLLRNDAISTLSPPEQVQTGTAAISDVGLIIWPWRGPPEWQHHTALWRNGKLSELTDWGGGGDISSNGNFAAIHRWFESSRTWQVMLYRDGQLVQLTDDEFWNVVGATNNRGELAWIYGYNTNYQVRALVRYSSGDLNCDGVVSVADIQPFVLALTRRETYDQDQPSCDALLADFNGDGAATVSDIAGFIDLLSSP